LFWDDHLPPHFHAEYSGMKALVSIENAVVIRGRLPSKQLKLVLAWCAIHENDLMENWEAARLHRELRGIDPLR
jgi:Domain of unknown function (DUF4160)